MARPQSPYVGAAFTALKAELPRPVPSVHAAVQQGLTTPERWCELLNTARADAHIHSRGLTRGPYARNHR